MKNNTDQLPIPPPKPEGEWHQRFYRYFIGAVLTGFEIILPIVIFIVVIRIIFRFVANLLAPISSLFTLSAEVKPWFIDLVSLLIAVLFIFLIGVLIKTRNGRKNFNNFEDEWLNYLPFYSTFRSAITQFVTNKRTPFSQVVLVDIYNNDTRMTGFITEEVSEDMFTVFVPTGPNPANGNIYHVGRSQLTFLPIKSEEALRTILGVGTGSSLLFQEKAMAKLKKERAENQIESRGL